LSAAKLIIIASSISHPNGMGTAENPANLILKQLVHWTNLTKKLKITD